MKFQDREAWLTEAANLTLDDLLMPLAESWGNGDLYERPNFRISVGFPKHSRGGRAVAVCFKREASTDGVNEIFINPEIDSPIEVMEAMVHELIHAIDNCESGHRNFFAYMARKAGLDGHLTKTHAGDKLKATLQDYADLLGEFPHRKMELDITHKKDKTRQLKVECTDSDCGFIFRTSSRQIEKMIVGEYGRRFCPACLSHTMVVHGAN